MELAELLGRGCLKLHQTVYERSGGLLGHRLLVVPSLLLHTTGRRTGIRRTNALVYAKQGGDFVLVASNGGSDHAPGWLFNARAEPRVDLHIGPKRLSGKAVVIESSDPAYAGLWDLVNKHTFDIYRTYQKKTSRPIPLVVVHPD